MKINDTQRIGEVRAYQKQSGQPIERAVRGRQKDEVRISPEAMELLASSKLYDTERAARIEALKQSVSTGTYHVEASRIAEKLLPYFLSK